MTLGSFLLGLFILNQAFAHGNNHHLPDAVCGKGEHIGNPHCITPTPTSNPCQFEISKDDWENNCISIIPTITVSPTAIPDPTSPPSPHGDGIGQTGPVVVVPGAATCNIPFTAPVLNGFSVLGDGAVSFSWLSSATNIDKFSIIYGYSPDALIMGEDNIPAQPENIERSVTLDHLEPGKHVFAILSAWRGGCEEASNLLDPIVR